MEPMIVIYNIRCTNNRLIVHYTSKSSNIVQRGQEIFCFDYYTKDVIIILTGPINFTILI